MLARIASHLDHRHRLIIGFSAAAVGWVLAVRLVADYSDRVPVGVPMWAVPVLLAVLAATGRWSLTAGRVVVVAAAVLFVLHPAVRLAEIRPQWETANEAITLSEDAVALLGAGENPYAADTTESVLRSAYSRDPGFEKTGLGYPPLAWLLFPVIEAPSSLLLGVDDPRPTYGLLAVGLAWFLARIATSLTGLAWAAVASSSGLLAYGITEGTHDTLVIALLVAALAQWGRPGRAALLIGLAATIKTLVWPMLPAALVALSALRRDRLLPVSAGLTLPLAVALAPFFVWSPSALLRAMLLTDDDAPSRSLSLRGPIERLVGIDLAWPLRLLVVAAACALAVWAVRRARRTLPTAAACFVLATNGVQLFSNVHHSYHLALPVALLVTAFLLSERASHHPPVGAGRLPVEPAGATST